MRRNFNLYRLSKLEEITSLRSYSEVSFKFPKNQAKINPLTVSTKFDDGTKTDQQEVDFHGSLASKWWDRSNVLHAYNEIRVPFIKHGLMNASALDKAMVSTKCALPLQDLNILDVGCGGGILSEALAHLGARVVGLDPSAELIEVAKNHLTQRSRLKDKITYVCGSVEKHAPSNLGAYDVVVASEVIEHVSDKDDFLKACVSALKPNGNLFVTTPNKTFASRIFVVFFSELVGIVPKGTHNHCKFIDHETLKDKLFKLGCATTMLQGSSYNFFTGHCYVSYFTSMKYELHARKSMEVPNWGSLKMPARNKDVAGLEKIEYNGYGKGRF